MSCYTYLIEKYGSRLKEHSVQLNFTATQEKVFFPADTLLLNKQVISMYFWDGADASPDDGAVLANKALQDNSFVWLKSNNIEIVAGSPLSAFNLNDDDKNPKLIMLPSFTPSKSFIIHADTSLIGTSRAHYLTFIYLD